jgi:hypothetical protein
VRVSQEFDLGEVEIDFISFVPRGANRKKYFLVKEDRQLKKDIIKTILETDEGEVSKIMKEAKLEGEAVEVLEGAAKLLKAYKDELPEDALHILAKACGLPEPKAVEKGGLENKEGDEGNSGQPAGRELTKEQLEKMDPSVRAYIEKAQRDAGAAQERAEKAETLAKDLKDREVLKEYVEKAEELEHLPVEPQKHGKIFKEFGEAHPKEFAEVFKILKVADKMLADSEHFKEIGKGGESGTGSAEAEVYSKARAMVTKDGKLTLDDAVCKVLDENPELYDKYEEERQENVRRRGGK